MVKCAGIGLLAQLVACARLAIVEVPVHLRVWLPADAGRQWLLTHDHPEDRTLRELASQLHGHRRLVLLRARQEDGRSAT